jgi:hypothetical protein
MKKIGIALSFIAMALVAGFVMEWAGKGMASAQIEATATTSTTATPYTTLGLPAVKIYTLTSDNTIYVLNPGSSRLTRIGRAFGIRGNLIGIDFRPADNDPNTIYGLTDLGNLYKISVNPTNCGAATLVSTLSPRFSGGFQSLMDFNPVVNALRLVGTNDQNYALVNGTGNLATTAVQTAFAYATGDVNQGADPNVGGGAYTNNLASAPFTLFYGLDYDLDTLVTISTRSATGSSNTGGGLLQTIGNLFDERGRRVNINPTADIDIYTSPAGADTLVGISGNILFTLDLKQIDPNLTLGKTQNITVKGVVVPSAGTDSFIDIAVPSAVK